VTGRRTPRQTALAKNGGGQSATRVALKKWRVTRQIAKMRIWFHSVSPRLCAKASPGAQKTLAPLISRAYGISGNRGIAAAWRWRRKGRMAWREGRNGMYARIILPHLSYIISAWHGSISAASCGKGKKNMGVKTAISYGWRKQAWQRKWRWAARDWWCIRQPSAG